MTLKHSYSSLRKLSACEVAWTNRYVRRLVPIKGESGPSMSGSWMHALLAVDSIERGLAAKSLIQMPDSLKVTDVGPTIRFDGGHLTFLDLPVPPNPVPISVGGVLSMVPAWWRKFQETEPEAAGSLAETLGGASPHSALLDLWTRYSRRWGHTRAQERPLLIEAWWEREIPGTGVVLRGRVDEVFVDARMGVAVVRDHKFSKDWSSDQDEMVELTGVQLHLGAWALAPVLAKGGAPKPLAVEYNRGLYAPPTSPQLTKGTRNADGTWKTPPRLSKATTRYDLATYEAFCRSEACEEVGYEPESEVVEKLTKAEMGDDWWRRHLRPISLTVVNRHLRAAVRHHARALPLVEDPSTALPSPGEACRWCDYRSHCVADFFGNLPEEFDPRDYGLRYTGDRKTLPVEDVSH